MKALMQARYEQTAMFERPRPLCPRCGTIARGNEKLEDDGSRFYECWYCGHDFTARREHAQVQ